MARDFIGLRCKMGVEIRAYAVCGFISFEHAGTVLHIASDSVRHDPVALDAAYLTAWRDASGFVPFTVIRRYRNGFKSLCTSFRPASRDVSRIVYMRGGARISFV